jgi:hypothetical protein
MDLREKEQNKLQLIEKKTNYAMYGKEVYLPAASLKKQREMEERLKKIHHPVREKTRILPSQTVHGSPARGDDVVEEDELEYS